MAPRYPPLTTPGILSQCWVNLLSIRSLFTISPLLSCTIINFARTRSNAAFLSPFAFRCVSNGNSIEFRHPSANNCLKSSETVLIRVSVSRTRPVIPRFLASRQYSSAAYDAVIRVSRLIMLLKRKMWHVPISKRVACSNACPRVRFY